MRRSVQGALAVAIGVAVAGTVGLAGRGAVPVPTVVVLSGAGLAGVVLLHRSGGAGMVRRAAMVAAVLQPLQRYDPLGDLALLAAIALLLVDRSARERPRQPLPFVLVGGLALFTVGGFVGSQYEPAIRPFTVHLFFTGESLFGLDIAFSELLRFALSTIGVVWFAFRWRPTYRDAGAVYLAYAVGSAVSVIVGLLDGQSRAGREIGLTAHPVLFGLVSAIGVGTAAAVIIGEGRTVRQRAFGLVLLGVSAVGVLTSGTRSAVLVVLIAVALVTVGGRLGRHALAVGGAAFVAFSIDTFVPWLLRGTATFERLTGERVGAEASEVARAALRDETIDVIRDYPVTGIGFRYLLPPHNLILGAWVAAGLLGLLSFVVITLYLTRQALRGARVEPQSGYVLAVGVAFFLGSWVINVAYDRWLWLPITIALYRVVAGQAEELPEGSVGDYSRVSDRTFPVT